jgi:iron complex outermembrane receptor protein
VNRTLVLLNGRRLANEAIADGYANLDVIPMSAIARVEILRDGASSIYGSDAIGGVVNFITKRSFEGASAPPSTSSPKHSGGGDEQRDHPPPASATSTPTAGTSTPPSTRTAAAP